MEIWLSIGATMISLASALMAGLALRKNIAYANVKIDQTEPITYHKNIISKNGVSVNVYNSSFHCKICNPTNQPYTIALYLMFKINSEKLQSKKVFIEMSPSKTINRYITFDGFILKTETENIWLAYEVNNKVRKTKKFVITRK